MTAIEIWEALERDSFWGDGPEQKRRMAQLFNDEKGAGKELFVFKKSSTCGRWFAVVGVSRDELKGTDRANDWPNWAVNEGTIVSVKNEVSLLNRSILVMFISIKIDRDPSRPDSVEESISYVSTYDTFLEHANEVRGDGATAYRLMNVRDASRFDPDRIVDVRGRR